MAPRRFVFSVTLLFMSAPSLSATSIVILRGPNGDEIVAAADSQFTADTGPLIGCKIAQIEHSYWTALSGIAYDASVNFNSYQTALEAASGHKDSLDAIVSEVQAKTLDPLQQALKHRRKTIGEKDFWKQYKEGSSANTQAFWGLESGILRVVYIAFVLRTNKNELSVSPNVHRCPGDACRGSEYSAVLVGHHAVIDKFTRLNRIGMNAGNIESWAKRFVQMEVDHDPDCDCAPPIDVLRMDRSGLQEWVGDIGPLCQQPH